jgi:hypothetical protein
LKGIGTQSPPGNPVTTQDKLGKVVLVGLTVTGLPATVTTCWLYHGPAKDHPRLLVTLSVTVIPVLPGPAPAALQTTMVMAWVPLSFQFDVGPFVVLVRLGTGGTGVGVSVGQGIFQVTTLELTGWLAAAQSTTPISVTGSHSIDG